MQLCKLRSQAHDTIDQRVTDRCSGDPERSANWYACRRSSANDRLESATGHGVAPLERVE